MSKLFVILACLCLALFAPVQAFAITNPLSVPNNKFGIHILFPSELSSAAKLVNSSGGDWGYVTIPIQASDRNLQKWQAFMDQCRELHLIPILRLATDGDYFNTSVWRQPTLTDVLDFANFLNSLTWPTKNRYVIIFNEVNRADEWGGQADPTAYANILSFAVSAFKSKSPDFFIISSGMDNAAATTDTTYNEYTFLDDMNTAVPGIFNQVDGMASHSYPNPGFTAPPTTETNESIDSFAYERSLIESMSNKNLPVFITETGWSDTTIPASVIASYYQMAFTNVWNDSDIVAVTPFLLTAGAGPFTQFSFYDASGNPTDFYTAYADLPKTAGKPLPGPEVLGIKTHITALPVDNFSNQETKDLAFSVPTAEKTMLKWFLHYNN